VVDGVGRKGGGRFWTGFFIEDSGGHRFRHLHVSPANLAPSIRQLTRFRGALAILRRQATTHD
jgi:hypothetical protein